MEYPEPLPERLEAIYQEILNGHYDAPEWADVTATIPDHTATFHVFADALKIDGVRVNVSAEYEQKIADALGCSLLTPKLADLIWLQKAVLLTPYPMTITSSVQGMLTHSANIDKGLAAISYTGGLICTVGKHWVIDNAIASNGKACNYGWHFNGQSYQGISGETCASLIKDPKTGMYYKLIQGRGTAHDMHHADYSQICVLVNQWCNVDGNPMRLEALLQDPVLCALASCQGVMTVLRQPGVPEPENQQLVLPEVKIIGRT